MTQHPACWCGAQELKAFSAGYLRCRACETLVSARMPGPEIARVVDEENDFYGREYWFSHQETELGTPTILTRARTDLPERCLHWLRTALKYKLPPARVLELGSGHGGFVAMLGWAGFEATGLEVSPWVVKHAGETFQVPMLLGPVEDQQIEPTSLDMIALLDVLEHLRDPVRAMRHCLELLKADGVLLIQTPCYPEERRYEEMVARGDRFLEELQAREHLHLFSQRSLRELFRRLGAEHVAFEPAIFAEYDMFSVVSRAPLTTHGPAEVEQALSARPAGRLVQAMVDLGVQLDESKQRFLESETDRKARLQVIHEQGRRLGEAEAARNNLQAEVTALRQEFDVVEADRAARLRVIHEQGRRLGEAEAARNNLQAEVTALRQEFDVVETDRAARLRVIHEQGRRLGEAETERNSLQAERNSLQAERNSLRAERNSLRALVEAQEHQIRAVMAQLRALQQIVHAIRSGRVYKLLRRLGRWGWLDQMLEQASGGAAAPRHEEVRAGLEASTSMFAAYRGSIDSFNASQPNRELLDSIRAYNHRIIDELNTILPLKGSLLLDIGASPHGYALERALEHGAALYVGVGLDIARPEHVVGDGGNAGILLDTDAVSLQFPDGMFDVVLSISTLEHVVDVDGVLSEIARVLRPGGLALLTFEPIWSCSSGHHLHHFGDCAKLVPPWAHLTWTPEQMRRSLAEPWPEAAPLSLEQAIEWVYVGHAINRLTIRDYRDRLGRCPLTVEWMIDLKEADVDQDAAQNVALLTGMSVDELTTKGLSVLLRKEAKA